MKPTIIAITGASGAGKTTLSRYLERELHIPAIISTTTRPPRPDEIPGVDYYFVSAHRRPPESELLTSTRFAGHDYYALRRQLPRSGFCSYVVEQHGLQTLKRQAGPLYGLFTVTVQCTPELRVERGVGRERLERDNNLKNTGYEWVDYAIFNNGSLDDLYRAARVMMKILEQWQPLQ